MDERLYGIAQMCALFASILTSLYFLSQTGISTESFMTVNAFPLFEKMLSLNFLVFLLLASISIALVLVIGRKYPFKYALIFSIAGYGIGTILGIVIFKIPAFFLLVVVGALAIPLGIKFLADREKEVKYLKELRSGAAAAGRITMIIGIGFFFMLVFYGITNKDKIESDFVPEFLKMSVGDGITLDDYFQMQLVSTLLGAESQLLGSIDTLPEMKNLKLKSDPDAINLSKRLMDMNVALTNESTKQAALAQIKEQKIDFGKEVVQKLPIVNSLSKLSWIIYAISGIVTFSVIGSVIIKNLTAGIYALLMSAFPTIHTLVAKTE
jgi:hypothetical protein